VYRARRGGKLHSADPDECVLLAAACLRASRLAYYLSTGTVYRTVYSGTKGNCIKVFVVLVHG
jgi:hypothetical protein